jgi:hypothetical protein
MILIANLKTILCKRNILTKYVDTHARNKTKICISKSSLQLLSFRSLVNGM